MKIPACGVDARAKREFVRLLASAIQTHDLSTVIALLSHCKEADNIVIVNFVNKDGDNLLHFAAETGTPAIVQALIVFGFDIDAKNRKAETPRHKANVGTIDGNKIIYVLHAVGAQRCPPETAGCHHGCKHGENYTGIEPEEQPHMEELRKILDQMLHDSGMKKMADPGNCKRIKGGRLLCLDGGGIRGLVLVQMLLEIESVLRKPVMHCFDWIAGTSTGGILGLGLAAGKSLRECQALYFRIKENAFVGLRPYDSECLEKELKECLGANTVMADIEKPKIMITGALADRKPMDLHLFRNYEAPSAILKLPESSKFKPTLSPREQLLWKAARATSAAPSYFPEFGRFLDGGLIANNPTLHAMKEINEYNLALKASNREKEVIPLSLVVSLGTGIMPTKPYTLNENFEENSDNFLPDKKFARFLVGFWNIVKRISKRIRALAMLLIDQVTASNGHVVDCARTWCSMIGVPYYRFSPHLSTEVALDAKSDDILVNMMWTTKAFMHANRDVVQELATIIGRDSSLEFDEIPIQAGQGLLIRKSVAVFTSTSSTSQSRSIQRQTVSNSTGNTVRSNNNENTDWSNSTRSRMPQKGSAPKRPRLTGYENSGIEGHTKNKCPSSGPN
ncbi:85/88 kDa calcium-independent phospholipase A2-like [Temnothorax curvispinosus]|uniref:phospholipase A2 n=1 Tax=Temnothorax curvispinosus TaxID=300111 RepID=A0A6J1PMU4_9HYME|nr:85/88 kDa calcium-independent phospholipase A2-like [Temnothorax curvispinosus]